MQHSTQIPEVPALADFSHFAWHCSLKEDQYTLFTLSKIEGVLPALPSRFSPPTYALQLVTRGSIAGKINNHAVELKARCGVFWMTDHVLQDVKVSSDCSFYVLAFTTRFAEALNLQIPQAQLAQLLMRPVWPMTAHQMQIAEQYIAVLRVLIEENKSLPVVNLVRSLLYCLAQDNAYQPQQAPTFTRSEQICGQYLSLVEIHCRQQHTVEWYASQLHLAPKYLSNVVKRTMNLSPNACIDEALTRQAKSLLVSTSLSIQQIADTLGFQNQSHFGTFFRRQTGLSPSAFKQKGLSL